MSHQPGPPLDSNMIHVITFPLHSFCASGKEWHSHLLLCWHLAQTKIPEDKIPGMPETHVASRQSLVLELAPSSHGEETRAADTHRQPEPPAQHLTLKHLPCSYRTWIQEPHTDHSPGNSHQGLHHTRDTGRAQDPSG